TETLRKKVDRYSVLGSRWWGERMTAELPGTTALARVRNLGYTLPEQGPADSKYVAYQRLDANIYIAGQLPYVNGELAAAIGVAGLPRNSPVEIQMVCAAAGRIPCSCTTMRGPSGPTSSTFVTRYTASPSSGSSCPGPRLS